MTSMANEIWIHIYIYKIYDRVMIIKLSMDYNSETGITKQGCKDLNFGCKVIVPKLIWWNILENLMPDDKNEWTCISRDMWWCFDPLIAYERMWKFWLTIKTSW